MNLSDIMNVEIVAGNTLWRIAGLFGPLLVGFATGKMLKFLLARRAEVLSEHRPIIAAALHATSRGVTFLAFAITLSAGTSLLILRGAEELVGTCVVHKLHRVLKFSRAI
jgi:hypothetical protein